MTPQYEAAYELHQFLTDRGISYAVIGGLAVQYWGEPRVTRDVDATVLVPQEIQKTLVYELLEKFPARIENPIDFAIKNRVLLVRSSSGWNMDISFGLPGYEEEVMRRAVDCNIGSGRTIKFCSAEDLIIHKAVAGRPQDEFDISGIIYRQGQKLDDVYILKWLNIFSHILETDEVRSRFTIPWENFIHKIKDQKS